MTVHLNMLPYSLPNSENYSLPNIKYLWFLLAFLKFYLLSDAKQSKLSIREIATRGTVIAIIITVPSVLAFLISWTVLDNLIYAAILGAVIHFIAMGFSLKISKKILVKK